MRHLASSGVDVYTAMAGGAAALYGPKHGGANEAVLRMLEEIGTKENIPQFIKDVKDRKKLLMGFGHRVYKNYVFFSGNCYNFIIYVLIFISNNIN